ncbi:saccharopine dehydrogenase C-terminal domain-containing protein [Flavobacteriales bacterium]|nr:saccharopine dehydrogenase C-terminal domain-containing protein [Flavobacteriales bacterium]
MKKILVIGAGRSAFTLIRYLLNESISNNWKVIVADYNLDLVKKTCKEHVNARPIFFNVNDKEQRECEIKNSDIVVSMLPANLHALVANDCILFQKNLVTASYVSDEIQKMSDAAISNNLIFLNEVGLDPGIDHMSAMKIIDDLKLQGAEILSFKSYCGGLIHPQFDNNPWNYKFTWNPRNVILAGRGTSKFLNEKKICEIEYNNLFNETEIINVLDQGDFESYANRDSLSYISSYGLEKINTMYRGTLRKVGFSNSWNSFVKLGMTNDEHTIKNSETLSYFNFMDQLVPKSKTKSLEERFCEFLSINIVSKEFKKFKWLDLFTDKIIGLKNATAAQILQKILEDKLSLESKDKDMVVMQHQFLYKIDDKVKKLHSSLIVFGDDQQNTAMAKTVGLPVGISVKLVLNGVIQLKGIQIPTIKEIYNPILKELEKNKINFIEELI